MTEGKKGMSKGCLIGLIILGVIAVLIIVTGIVCYIYRDELIDMGISKITDSVATEIKANLPDGVTEEEVDEVLTKFRQSIKEGKIDQAEMQALSLTFKDATEDKKIDKDEAQQLFEQIKKAIE
nr:hypothetical protein [candidate division Zixibacteria bacterium]